MDLFYKISDYKVDVQNIIVFLHSSNRQNQNLQILVYIPLKYINT